MDVAVDAGVVLDEPEPLAARDDELLADALDDRNGGRTRW
jgi:hypothetical protein